MAIEKYGIKFHPNFFLLHKAFGAITLFGHVFVRKSLEVLKRWLDTFSGRKMANHERIHMIQAESFKTKYFGFYCYYIGYWIKNLFKYGFNIDAYNNIPFEREAYANELNFGYEKTHWRDYCD